MPGRIRPLLDTLREDLCREDTPFEGTLVDQYVVIRIPPERRHMWSPQLQFEATEDAGYLQLSGLFMPSPSVWTLFAGLYGVTVFGGFCGTVFGLAQLQLNHPPLALWSLPAALLLLALIYLTAQVGQRLGHAQMNELQTFLESVLNRAALQDAPH